MSKQKEISHEGYVKRIENNKIVVEITSVSACAGCHANGACSMADTQNKEIEIVTASKDFNIGEKVEISGKETQGMKAILLGYLFPFFILLISLIVLLSITKNEAISGIGSLVSLGPYYLILYFLRNRLKKTFTFEIKKLPKLDLLLI